MIRAKYASLHGRHPPAKLAQIEQNVERTEGHDLVNLRITNAKSSTVQSNYPDNNRDVAFTHESHHPYEKGRARRE